MELWISVLIYLLEFFLVLLLFYLLLPLAWKVASPWYNAAYRPGELDQIAQPKPDQLQDSIPKVMMDETGGYRISFGIAREFIGGMLQIHYQGQWYSSHPSKNKDKSLKLISTEEFSGSDAFGAFQKKSLKWNLEGTSITIQSNIIIYPNQPILQFQLEFPSGLKEVSTKNLQELVFKFPCFRLEGPNKRVLAYKFGVFSPPKRSIRKSTQGPVVFYDNELNSLVFGPLDHFMIAFTKQDPMISHGLEGMIKEIPPGYTHSSLLMFTKGINKAVVDWCALLQKYHRTRPKTPYADPVVGNLGFWTDNGAYYYYRKEKGMNYEQTILYASQIFRKNNIPFKYYQLDSWWYQKDMKTFWKYPPFRWLGRLIGGGAFGGTILWEAIPEEFPNGLKALQEKIRLNFACHARWFSPKSPYIQKYKCASGKTAVLPMESRFWEDIMRESAKWGLIMYEQDWLRNTFSWIPLLQEDVYAADNWLTWMAEAAQRNKISIQYCMAPSGAFLYALKLPAITNARVTGDYSARITKQFYYPHFSQTNILAWGAGIWPSLDCYLTTKTPHRLYREKYPDQVTLLSNLGGGIICPADKAECVDRNLLMKTCTEEGVLLKPDRPITANDLMFRQHRKPYIMDTFTEKEGLFWRYIVVVNLWPRRVKDTKMTLRELGYTESGVLYDFFTDELKELRLDDPIDLPVKGMECKYFIIAPWLSENLALIGATQKFVSIANKLIPKVEYKANVLRFSVDYSPNSTLKLLIYSKSKPSAIKLKDTSGSIKWDCDAIKNRLDLELSFTTNNFNEITIEFYK
jgi:hypothetical protein